MEKRYPFDNLRDRLMADFPWDVLDHIEYAKRETQDYELMLLDLQAQRDRQAFTFRVLNGLCELYRYGIQEPIMTPDRVVEEAAEIAIRMVVDSMDVYGIKLCPKMVKRLQDLYPSIGLSTDTDTNNRQKKVGADKTFGEQHKVLMPFVRALVQLGYLESTGKTITLSNGNKYNCYRPSTPQGQEPLNNNIYTYLFTLYVDERGIKRFAATQWTNVIGINLRHYKDKAPSKTKEADKLYKQIEGHISNTTL